MFPCAWKSSVIVPIFKSGDPHSASNYRPISMLPIVSKVAEKLMAAQITNYLNNSYFALHPMQFGFRANYSTEMANCYFIEKVKSLLDKGGVVGAVFLDLRKAFDTLNQGSSNLILEGRCPAEFSSNLPQHTCMEVSSIPSKTLISCFRCV